MNPLQIYEYVKEKGYSHSNIYKISDGDEGDLYTVRVFKDYPKADRFAKYFYATSIIELFYAIQSEL